VSCESTRVYPSFVQRLPKDVCRPDTVIETYKMQLQMPEQQVKCPNENLLFSYYLSKVGTRIDNRG
jgi:hypothetical protein